MKIISTLLVALFALASLANAKSNIAPKIVLTVDAQSAKTVCPEPGQVVKITIITGQNDSHVTGLTPGQRVRKKSTRRYQISRLR